MSRLRPRPRPIRLGFVALTDAAPLIVAAEHGWFRRHGLEVELSREIGWATLRDKVLYGELEAAHALAGMLLSTHLGIDSPAGEVMTACVLSLQGNAITVSRALREAGVRDAPSLRQEVLRTRHDRRLTFGVVYPGSFHHVQLREWLRGGGIDPDRDIRVVVVPPAQMFRNLAAGTIDGCCVGEPWNSLAVARDAGCIVSWSALQFPGHIEKVLMVRSSYAERHPGEHAALVAALVEACAWCDEAENRSPLAALLARPRYLDLPPDIVARALTGPFRLGDGREIPADDLVIFHREGANAPSQTRANELLERFIASDLLPRPAEGETALVKRIFREDLFAAAMKPDYAHASEKV